MTWQIQPKEWTTLEVLGNKLSLRLQQELILVCRTRDEEIYLFINYTVGHLNSSSLPSVDICQFVTKVKHMLTTTEHPGFAPGVRVERLCS